MEPTLVKDFIVAHSGLAFKNGDQEFDLTVADLDRMVANHQRMKSQVPVLFRGDHAFGADRADRPAGGWVESLYRKGKDLWARVKLHGEAALAVMNDEFRGVSIGAFSGRDRHGRPVGDVLDHLLITNAPFFDDLNIAARRSAGGASVAYITLARRKEAKMAEKDTAADVADGTTDTPEGDQKIVALKAAHEAEVVKLKGEILALQEKLDNATVDEEKHQLALRVANLEKKTLAQEIRETVFKMLREGTVKPGWCEGYAKGGDDGTITWFQASKFKGDLKLLKWCSENSPVLYKLNQQHSSGTPDGADPKTMTTEDKDYVKSVGGDPELVLAARQAGNLEEFKALTVKKKEA